MQTPLISKIFFLISLVFVISGCGNTANYDKNRLDIKGSDTLLQLSAVLAEAYMDEHIDKEISITGGGSGTGIASLFNGEVKLANSSRDVKPAEVARAKLLNKDIYKFIVARDGLSIIVNRNNPLQKLTVDEVAQIFKGEIDNWQTLGGNSEPITLYGRQSTSGTYEFMQKEILQGDYAESMRNLEGNQAIVDAIISDPTGIGYVGIAYALNAGTEVNTLNIALDRNKPYYSPKIKANILNGNYPITRPLFQFFITLPAPNSLTHQFLQFESNEQSYKLIEQVGYYPPNSNDKIINQQLFEMIENSSY